MSFGTRLRQLRLDKGITQGALGKGLGAHGKDVSKASLSDWEKGNHFPKVDQLVVICERLAASADYLLFGKEVATGLSPEVAALARQIEALHGQRRDQVMMICKGALSIASNGSSPDEPVVPQTAANG
jgi:transcriptional regulator with XRE-family HTH domain